MTWLSIAVGGVMPMAQRSIAVPVVAILVAALLVPRAAAYVGPSSVVPTETPTELADLGAALARDGRFLGAPDLSGAIDASAWNLVSDLAAGEPPRFEPAGSTSAADGATWSALGSNGPGNGAISNQVRALVLLGSNLYVGGLFTDAAGIPEADYVARWNGSAWLALGSNGVGVGALNAYVTSLGVLFGHVYVGGNFTDAAGIATADFVAHWSGSSWGALGSFAGNGALNNTVNALAMKDGNVFLGGFFTDAAGLANADYVARWNGNWSALGSNVAGTNGALGPFVYALALSGSDVYVGGSFTDAAGIAAADRVARWNIDTGSWAALGANQAGTNGAISAAADFVVALAVSGSDVFVGGSFSDAAGLARADHLARWNGTVWSALGSNGSGNGALNEQVRALAVLGTTLYVGGAFTNAAAIATADRVARWSGGAWSAVGSNAAGTDGALTGDMVFALAASGSAVYVGGGFINASGVAEADFLALALLPGPWSALGSNSSGNGALNSTVRALAVSGTDLYVGGLFTDAAGIPEADYVARWNGNAWSALGSNLAHTNGALNSDVYALKMWGGQLYVGGTFTNAADNPEADHVARWSGSAWSALGSNGSGNGALRYPLAGVAGGVGALAVWADSLYVSGIFLDAAGIATADFIARWNGSAWSALGSNAAGTNGALNLTARALTVWGSSLYVGGDFNNAAGIAEADGIARWNGSAWSALGSNGAGNGALYNGSAQNVFALAASGSELYAGGRFTNAAGLAAADHVARWNGSAWSALGNSALSGAAHSGGGVGSLTVFGTDLYVGGAFQGAAGIAEADFAARWNGSKWSAVGSNGAGNGALNNLVLALAVAGTRLYLGGEFTNAHDIPAADYVAAYGPIASYQPDGRIRKGSDSFAGNNVYNTDATNQARTGTAASGSTITFDISVQNDGKTSDRFKLRATGAGTTMYSVQFFSGTTEITSAVVAGTYQTLSLGPGATELITVKVEVLATATVGSSVTRLVTIKSVAEPAKVDAVRFTGKRG